MYAYVYYFASFDHLSVVQIVKKKNLTSLTILCVFNENEFFVIFIVLFAAYWIVLPHVSDDQ